MKKTIFLILLAAVASACGSGAVSTNKAAEPPTPFSVIASEFKQSAKATNDKYKGKTLTVKGYALVAPILPTGADDAGILSFGEKGGDLLYMMTCQFTAAQKDEFAKLTGEQFVTVTGVYDDDDMAMRLKSCRVVE